MTCDFINDPREALTKDEIHQAYTLWCGGWNMEQIAAKYNCHEMTIKRCFKRHNLKKQILPSEVLLKSNT